MSAVSADEPGITEAVDSDAKQVRREQLRELRKSKTFLIGASILGFWIVCAVIGYRIVPYTPFETDLLHTDAGPSTTHWFGTDQIGRDIFSRTITGVRAVLIVAFVATVLGTVLGTLIGLITGYMRGWVDEGISRFVDALLALPLVITAVVVISALGPSNITVTICIGFIFAPLVARTVRTAVIQERELDYVTAARLRNENGFYIMISELLPNVLAPVLVEFTVRLGYAVFTVATLSFLGFGIPPPTPDWGVDISNNISVVQAGYWWEVLFAAAAIASLVISVNLIADAIEKVVDE